MAGENDFLVFDSTGTNLLSDQDYSSDEDRLNGFKTGIARSIVNNKVLYQTSKIASAIGQIIADNNDTAQDSLTSVQLASKLRSALNIGIKAYSLYETYALNDVVIGYVNNEVYLAKSLLDNNLGKSLSDTTYFEQISLGADLDMDTINQSKALETGALSSNATVYNDVYSYAHSTFDESKFTVIGSPKISEDGVYTQTSKPSLSNYLRLSEMIDTTNAQTLHISFECRFVQLHTGGSQLFIFSYNNVPYNGVINVQNYNPTSDATNPNYINLGSVGLAGKWENNKLYRFEIACNTNAINNITYTVYKEGNLLGSYTTTKTWQENNYMFFGGNYSGSDAVCEIYLNTVQVLVDGITVFSGNQTGIDTYTINGETVTIPYFRSKTGSKIVDYIYYDNVLALYEQEGYAPYYTIDENNKQFSLPMGEIYGMINKTATAENIKSNNLFTATSGNLDDKGNADILAISGSGTDTSCTFNVGGTYGSLNLTNIDGTTFSLSSIPSLDMSGSDDGTYNVFVGESGTAYALANTIYRQPAEPAGVSANAIWQNTSLSPMSVKQLNTDSEWETFSDIPIGSLVVDGGYITSVETFPYNNKAVTIANNTMPATIVESYTSGTSWYRVWSDGWIEQAGKASVPANSQYEGTFLKAFSNTNYTFLATNNNQSLLSGYWGTQQGCGGSSTTAFYLRSAEDVANTFSWYACGY